jgi:hypothetical protein
MLGGEGGILMLVERLGYWKFLGGAMYKWQCLMNFLQHKKGF